MQLTGIWLVMRVGRYGLILASILGVSYVFAGESILVQSTTSTANSGLYDHLLPMFQTKTGVKVNVVAVGTGQAIRNARNCDADVLLVHAKEAEEQFVEDGYGIKRFDLMYNDFLIVGPSSDPAGVAEVDHIEAALELIATGNVLFASRGDDSGTHKKELALWEMANIDPVVDSGTWYRETGSGMGATLSVAVGMNAYTMTDRATWISFKNKADFKMVFSGDSALFNQYGVMVVSPEKCQNNNHIGAQEFVDWLLSSQGQNAIESYRVDNQQLFFPNGSSTD